MGNLTSAVHWWEESQLRALVLSSLVIQYLLFIFCFLRKMSIPGWLRSIMWLAYLAGDAVAIYALATLFNRHKAVVGEDGRGGSSSSSSSSSMLQVVWAPVLLIHLGGHDGINAYNIEDNELWSRHLLTAVSQVTVAIYVFCKTWPLGGGDKRLLQAAIVLFVPGVLKCFHKPWALKSASIYSLVSSPAAVKQKEGELKAEGYVKQAMDFVRQQKEEGEAQGAMEDEGRRPSHNDMAGRAGTGTGTAETLQLQNETSKLFVDLSSSYSRRLSILEHFCGLTKERAYGSVRQGLVTAFRLLYTKLKRVNTDDLDKEADIRTQVRFFFISPVDLSRMVLPWAAIGLFHNSHREAYNGLDVKESWDLWPEMVGQRSFIGYISRSTKHSNKIMRIVSRLLGCKDFLDRQHWRKRPGFSSCRITGLVHQYLKDGWKQKIHDAASYRRFNDNRGHWAIEGNEHLGWSIKQPFDESVLLWHIAMDFCFFLSPSASDHSCFYAVYCFYKRPVWYPKCGEESTDCKSVISRHMSNYMTYLLLVDPEMLLPGSRRNLCTRAQEELEDIFKNSGDNPPPGLDKRALAKKIISKLRLSSSSQQGVPDPPPPQTFIHEAWKLAQALQNLGNQKMWEVIQGVWVEMLCYSAGRCRGYLHAKALGKGGEFLSYVWLMMFYMGMETFTDKLQREDLPSPEAAGTGTGNNAIAGPTTTLIFERVSSTTGGTAASAYKAHADAAGASNPPSTSEIRSAWLKTWFDFAEPCPP